MQRHDPVEPCEPGERPRLGLGPQRGVDRRALRRRDHLDRQVGAHLGVTDLPDDRSRSPAASTATRSQAGRDAERASAVAAHVAAQAAGRTLARRDHSCWSSDTSERDHEAPDRAHRHRRTCSQPEVPRDQQPHHDRQLGEQHRGDEHPGHPTHDLDRGGGRRGDEGEDEEGAHRLEAGDDRGGDQHHQHDVGPASDAGPSARPRPG